MLHQVPTPEEDTTLRRRRGYSPLPSTANDDGSGFPTSPRETDALHTPPPEPALEVPEEKEGWSALTWSFAASGAMTASFLASCAESLDDSPALRTACRVFLPRGILYTSVRNISGVGMAMDIHAQPILYWSGYHHGFPYNLEHEPGRSSRPQ